MLAGYEKLFMELAEQYKSPFSLQYLFDTNKDRINIVKQKEKIRNARRTLAIQQIVLVCPTVLIKKFFPGNFFFEETAGVRGLMNITEFQCDKDYWKEIKPQMKIYIQHA